MKKRNLGIISAVFLLIAAGIFYQIVWAFPPTPPANMASPGPIGSNTPNTGSFTLLTIQNPLVTDESRIRLVDVPTDTSLNRGFAIIKGSTQDGWIWNYENQPLHFGTNNLERMTIGADGVVDIPEASITVLSVVGKIDWGKASDLASASTTDIGAANGVVVDITGTNTITSFGNVTAGTTRLVRFTGALTLTYNASSLILPGSRDIVTEAGDRGTFVSLGSGNWFCHAFTKANGRVLGDIIMATDSGTANVTVDKMRGQVHNITGAYTESLPTAAIGYSATFYASTAAAFSIDVVTGTDIIILNGSPLTAGYKATSDGTINAEIYCESRATGYYNCKSVQGVFIDGGA